MLLLLHRPRKAVGTLYHTSSLFSIYCGRAIKLPMNFLFWAKLTVLQYQKLKKKQYSNSTTPENSAKTARKIISLSKVTTDATNDWKVFIKLNRRRQFLANRVWFLLLLIKRIMKTIKKLNYENKVVAHWLKHPGWPKMLVLQFSFMKKGLSYSFVQFRRYRKC